MSTLRVEVIEDQCGAHGYCEGIAPEFFRLGDGDEVELLRTEVPPDKRELVEQAVVKCPKAALRLVQ